ncbi:methyltransferase domain-containing protein [Spirosoma endophyticum]|uniref:Methyltransferase domain-containing protein n=1 Tax=Spirosoma endophyticum TaxID=662367 RepID=A0A1I1TGW9_9BACT|nr:methyltransferase domain-containing protein [Spirosoma endophyticum]SFD55663.1 Methyltransferase domain-containing protein [Spirosoma endophyticum]
MKCKICLSNSAYYLSVEVLGKYNIKYYKCSTCQFIQTEDPYWLSEAYANAITKLDIGLITRNEFIVPVVKAVINKWFNPDAQFIDYGGGYGMLVRMMRDRGYNFYRQDIYCDNLYAQLFDVTDVPPFTAELLTAFEVFEHLVDPVVELEKILTFSDTVLFSTTVQPTKDVSPESWWYFTPETGQHISLYSRASLQALADRFSLNYNWNDQNVHLFSKKKINNRLFKAITHPRWGHWYNKIMDKHQTLLEKDFSFVQNRLKESFLLGNLSNK